MVGAVDLANISGDSATWGYGIDVWRRIGRDRRGDKWWCGRATVAHHATGREKRRRNSQENLSTAQLSNTMRPIQSATSAGLSSPSISTVNVRV